MKKAIIGALASVDAPFRRLTLKTHPELKDAEVQADFDEESDRQARVKLLARSAARKHGAPPPTVSTTDSDEVTSDDVSQVQDTSSDWTSSEPRPQTSEPLFETVVEEENQEEISELKSSDLVLKGKNKN